MCGIFEHCRCPIRPFATGDIRETMAKSSRPSDVSLILKADERDPTLSGQAGCQKIQNKGRVRALHGCKHQAGLRHLLSYHLLRIALSTLSPQLHAKRTVDEEKFVRKSTRRIMRGGAQACCSSAFPHQHHSVHDLPTDGIVSPSVTFGVPGASFS